MACVSPPVLSPALSLPADRLTVPAMNAHVTVEPVEFFRDARGWVIEPVNEAMLAGKRNAHMVLTEPGAIRGNHYHKRSDEVLVVVGPALVRFREAGTTRDVDVSGGQAMRFAIPAGVPHAIKNTGNQPMILVSFATQPHDRAHPDTVPAVLIQP